MPMMAAAALAAVAALDVLTLGKLGVVAYSISLFGQAAAVVASGGWQFVAAAFALALLLERRK